MALSKTIKINFCDWWDGFNKKNNKIYNLLIKNYDIDITTEPEYLFYSVYGLEHLEYKDCVKIFINGENLLPNFNECDYGEGPDYMEFGDRYFRHNNWFINTSMKNRDIVDEKLLDRRFCNFIYANSGCGEGSLLRQEFCKKLMQYKHIDCPGKVLNNMSAEDLEPRNGGNWWHSKLAFLKKYKFTIAFENCSFNGYTTEKLVQPLQSFSIPIYWGNPLVIKDFNPRAFINCNDFDNDFNAVIERVKELDNDPDKYLAMLRENPMQPDFDFDQGKKYETWLYNIIEKGNKSFCKDPANWGTRHWEKKIKDLNHKLASFEKIDTCTARIDITTPLVDANAPQFDVYVDGSETPEKQSASMPKWGYQGYAIQKDRNNNLDVKIKSNVDTSITLECKGKWEQDKFGKLIEHYVDFTSLTVNGEEVLPQTTSVWYRKPFNYTLKVKKNDIINVHAKWKKVDDISLTHSLKDPIESLKTQKADISDNKNIAITDCGEDNTISVPQNLNGKLSIDIYGNNNQVLMDKVGYFVGAIHIGTQDCPVDNCIIVIGEKTTSNGINVRILEDNSKVTIGKDCQFSSGVWLYCSDTHTITDMKGNITNIGQYVNIGNHVWVGMNACIGKNTAIGDNCVVGMCSVVTTKQKIPANSVIAGNPAKIVRNLANWNRLRPKAYIMQNNDIKNKRINN